MLAIVAERFYTTADVIEETMTLAQIQLHYVFYLRERHRDADRIAMTVCARAFGGAQ